MTAVAAIGLTANIISTLLLRRDSKYNFNFKFVYLHLFSDAVLLIGVVMGGIAIHFWQIFWLDPALTIRIMIVCNRRSRKNTSTSAANCNCNRAPPLVAIGCGWSIMLIYAAKN